MNKNVIVAAVILILLLVGGFLFLGQGDDIVVTTTLTPAMTPAPTPGQGVREFLVTARNFSFSLSEMRVVKGNTVWVTLHSEEGRHDWRIDEFGAGTDRLLGINTAILQAGQQETVQFVADKAGTFEYYCSIGNHREMGMRGNLIVEE